MVLKITNWLGKQDLAELTNSADAKVVLFAAKWCGYCAQFFQVVKDYKAPNDSQLFLVDADNPDESLWDIYNLKLVPTLIAFQSGKQLTRKDAKSGIGLRAADLEDVLNSLGSKTKSS